MAIADQFDAVVVGAGLSGAVMAERLADVFGLRVLVIDDRSHIGGNVHDGFDRDGILVHTYGPHLFHTDNSVVWDYLSRFTGWLPYQHRVLARFDEQFTPVPFNYKSIRIHFPEASRLIRLLETRYPSREKVPVLELMKSSDPELKKLARFVYEKVFLQYTSKQWGVRPEEISPEVTGRVPILLSDREGYFTDRYQFIPDNGYTSMVKKMLDHPLITLRLGQSSVGLIELRSKGQVTIFGERFVKPLIYTGMIDQLFDYCAGELPYRSLKFVREHHKIASYQPAAVVNYTGNEAFTRITEFRKITGQHAPGTTIFKEYPGEYQRGSSDFGTPYYPKFTQQAQEKYLEYKKQADQCDNLFLCGRLATYKYLDMDDAVAGALDLFDNQLTAFLRREACGSR